jgi:hypothetical protein
MAPPDTHPPTLFDVQGLTPGVNEIELSQRVLLVQAAVGLHGRDAVWAGFHHGHTIEQPPVVLCVRFQRLNDQPLIGILLSYF